MKIFIIIFASLFCGYSLKCEEDDSTKTDKILYYAQKFKYILDRVNENYVDSADWGDISEEAYAAMLKKLDPHSVYVKAKELKKQEERNKGSAEGVGLNIVLINDTAVVISVVPDSPADSAQIKTGSKILFVNGHNMIGKSKNDIIDEINGQIGSTVSIIIKSGYSSNLKEYLLKREKIPITSVNAAFMIPNTKIGYISQNRFSSISDSEFVSAAAKLKDMGMEALIYDLRNNQGGVLAQTANIAGQFLNENDTITYTKARNEAYKMEYIADGEGELKFMPIVIAVNGVSASGSEVIAGAIQDLDRGLVVGERTFGKGLVQRSWKLKDNSGFRITVARYYTPSGRSIQKPYTEGKYDEETLAEYDLYEDKFLGQKIKEIIKKYGANTKLPIYYSKKGRPVIGGGGIAPDYVAKEDTTTLLTRVLKKRGYILEYVFLYIYGDGANLKQEYDNFEEFQREFSISDVFLLGLKDFSTDKKIWNDEMFAQDKEYLRAYLKAVIAYLTWGTEAYEYVMLSTDKVVEKAIETCEEAKRMVNE